VRALVASLSAAVLVLTSACSSDDGRAHPYGVQSAAMGQQQAVLGWNMGLSNLRFDGDYVLFDVDASPTKADGPHAKPEDLRFGLYGALAHPLEANAIGGCRDVTDLGIQPAAAYPVGVAQTNQNDTGLALKTTSVDAFRADGAQLDPTALGDPNAFNGKGYMLLGLEISGLAARYRDDSAQRGGPMMVLAAPTVPAPGLSHACDIYGASQLVLPDASLDAVAVRASLCTQGDMNPALLYASVSLVGTHAALWTTGD